jgi:ribonuclease D
VTQSLPKPNDSATHVIDNDAEVRVAASQIGTLSQIALDTEFHAERRYHPELMLLQLAGPAGQTWIADPRACDLGRLIRAIATRPVIVHGGQADMAILHRESGVAPSELFDVQIAAGLVGLGYPARLGNICANLLGSPIDKGATLSDWSLRPLSPVQVRYALQDVQVLFPLLRALTERLSTHGRFAWAQEASADISRDANTSRHTQHKWTQWEIAPGFDADTQGTLQAIFEWRDARGRDKDQPPHFMLGDGIALDLARRRPHTLEALAANRRIPGGLVRRYGAELVHIIANVNIPEHERVEVPSAHITTTADALQMWAKLREPITGLAAKLVMPRALALDIAHHGIIELKGWREAAIGAPLSEFLEGKSAIQMGPEGLYLSQS